MPLIIVFYSSDSVAAKQRGREIVAQKEHHARIYDASVWDGSPDQCDGVMIMPDVLGWQRNRILDVFGDRVMASEDEVPQSEVVSEDQGKVDGDGNPAATTTKLAVHRGGGRWFVMNGE